MEIKDKDEMYRLLKKGALGNTILMWDSFHEFENSDYQGPVGIRYRGNVGGSSFCVAQIPRNKINKVISVLVEDGYDFNRMEFLQSPPDEYRTIQGELQLNPEYYLYYSTYPAPMREALEKDGKHLYGIEVKMFLQKYLTPSSYDDIQELLILYSNSVIEFTAFSRKIGWARGRNAIVWEVRNY